MKRLFVLSFVMFIVATAMYAQPTTPSAPRQDGIYKRTLLGTREIIPYDDIREADIYWEKRIWRNIDFREKINLAFTWPVDPFVQIVYDAVVSGELKAYSPLYDDFSEGTELPLEQIIIKFNRTDTTWILDEETYEEKPVIIKTEFDYQTVQKIQIKEDWVFDEETSTMVVRIIGLTMIRDRIDPTTGETLGSEPMFWIYYPDLRGIIIRHEVFNEKNSARYLTFEDIFEMRLFSSYIVKEDNVYDRFIENYTSGIDQVLESERIKQQIFDFEHNLWEF
ncbi:MAG: gliding motility protein GldN [Chitinophagales bacterium]|jgi:gliding motility associated protien GldN|nr:gliding motility protein GldN [Bacteroidota bacterium]MBP8248796.1 gliding motility protein GldN [Chitinophagales bacterium]MBK9506179.1 gliding motility protein GldN [Bacteroidota bacterium]MBK9555334.1 gliding motility protein GldN [Bacteroidota bacterium]MBL0279656.1 gliding motility protein GldN [Bacteroidota bacterium]